ncbi:MAG: cell division protein ZapA [Rhodospirillales bacterium]
MSQIDVRINGRPYTISCDDGEESHVVELAGYIDRRLSDLVAKLGQVGDARLLVMTSLLIADELAEAYSALEQAQGGEPVLRANGNGNGTVADNPALADSIESLARRIETIAARLGTA